MMFSTYSNNEQDQMCSDNNDHSDIRDTTALIITSQYLDDNNRNYSFFNSPNSVNNHNSIFIQPNQIETYSSEVTSGHEHLMILAAAAVNPSPDNDSYKCVGNAIDQTLINSTDSPHFSIHDPPLIRLSPTSPNNVFRSGRHEDFRGITNETHNNGYSPNNVDWLSQELYVKTENAADELTHSSLKRHSFTNPVSDPEIPQLHLREVGGRDRDNSTSNQRNHKELKRKRMYDSRSGYHGMVSGRQMHSPASVDDFTTNLNTSNYINLTESDGEGPCEEERIDARHRLTPELARREFQWWPIKRHCTDPINDPLPAVDLGTNRSTPISPVNLVSSPDVITSPYYEASDVTNQFSPLSPPLYLCAPNNAEGSGNYPGQEQRNSEGITDNHYDNTSPPIATTTTHNHSHTSAVLLNGTDYNHVDPRLTSSNVSSYLRHVLVPQFCTRRPYAMPTVQTSFRDFSRLYLPQPSANRPCPYRSLSHSRIIESDLFYPQRSSSDQYPQSSAIDPDNRPMQVNQTSAFRSSRHTDPTTNASEDHHMLTETHYPHHPIHPTVNTFLRAYGFGERQGEEAPEVLRDPRLRSDSVRLHPLLRISERINPLVDSRSGIHYPRPFAMYESQGNVESVIQLALHLETSWRGISPEEFAMLPCHYYGEAIHPDSANHCDKQDKCMVCLDEFITNDQLRTLSCGHQYHVICVDKWLKMNRTCPMCRSDAVIGSSNYVYVNQ